MIDTPLNPATTFDRIVRLIQVTVWPIVLVACILIYRRSIDRLVHALVKLAEGADELKLWQLEIKRTVEKVAEASSREDVSQVPNSIPEAQKTAAAEIKAIVLTARSPEKRILLRQSVRRRMTALASDYEKLRREMPSGQERTSAMNVLVAKMRSLGLASRPFLREFSADHSAGMRLAAVAILQVSPSSDYLDWLFSRFTTEQPFIFFQASLAVLQAVRKYGPRRPHALHRRISQSIKELESFEGGAPDANTLRTLRNAQIELEQMHPSKRLKR